MAESYVTSSAMISCTFGTNPCPLMANPSRMSSLSSQAKLNVSDFATGVNVSSFGMCSSPSNPMVIAATAAALGVPTPAPCVPALVGPWIPGKPDIMIDGMPALTNQCRNTCMWAGQISFTNDGQIPIPPPMTAPPAGSLSKVPTGDQAPLTESEMGQLSVVDQQQYKEDLAKANMVGTNEEKMGEAWKKTSDDYAKKGESEKAAMASKKSKDALDAGADKRNIAIGNVNQNYRGKTRKE
ncbi:MAG: DUF4280 domain-containing protein [Bacteroidales bacterium]|nr:DUF4280 domain-containing protein [Bacteroidales bacterium]